MADYDLSQLSSRSFEHLIQALSVKVIGPGLRVFGDGPDGGREATFEGTMPYPTEISGWNGYCVIQAKFRQRLRNSKEDRQWVLSELKKEIDKYLSPHSDLRRPDYLIFATNVTLSPVNKSGTKDRATSMLNDLKRRLPLKDFDIWDYDKIRVFLDSDHEVRRTNTAWITPGDVLATIIDQLNPERTDFKDTMYNFLQKQLLSDEYVNLDQAGHDADERIPLAQVFIDLHTTEHTNDPDLPESPDDRDHEYHYNENDSETRGIVSQILEAAGERLDRKSLSVTGIADDQDSQLAQRSRGRYVLIGGPGQGKTTVAQFICQIFRASILWRLDPSSLSSETCDAIALINQHCQEDNIEMSVVPRYPFRIVLNEFAKDLSNDSLPNVKSVTSYLAYQIHKTTDHEIETIDLRNWLAKYPTVVVFDGLDEVPSSSNRDQVLAAIRDFWIDTASVNADILALATSRPQGYNDDFRPSYYQHQRLAPLSKALCSRFARRLAAVRFGPRTDRTDKVLSRLDRALESASTARLMRSPLQVTIMTALVDKLGQPPQARWNLFKAYYDVIYQREVEREIPASAILRKYRPDINAIHSHVGLLLQADSEQTGRTDTKFPQDRFVTLVTKRLEAEGHSGDSLQNLANQIVHAALDRLVFLVGLESDQVGFEIRSLQEFMAAESLMEGSDDNVQKRLHEIGPLSNWRNVFLFAAGKCFSERQHLRDTVYSVCGQLNENPDDEIQRASLAGSSLAMDLLDDGLATNQPKFIQSLARIAVRSLDVDNESYHMQLAHVYDAQLKDLYTSELEQRLNDERIRLQLNAWNCLLNLVAAGIEWAQEMAMRYWPDQVDQQARILEACRNFGRCDWATDKLLDLVPSESFERLREIVSMGAPYAADRLYLPLSTSEPKDEVERYERAVFKALLGDPFHPRRQIGILDQSYLGFASSHRASDDSIWSKDLQRIPITTSAHPTWDMVRSAAQFLQNPTRHVLAAELVKIAAAVQNEPDSLTFRWHWQLPWPLAACLQMCTEASEVLAIARRAQHGELGDTNDWMKAEDRWAKSGVTENDLLEMTDDRLPFDSRIAYTGFPLTVTLWPIFHASADVTHFLENLIKLRSRMPLGRSRSFVSTMTITMLHGHSFFYAHSDKEPQPLIDISSLEAILADLPPNASVPIEVIINQLDDSSPSSDIGRLFRIIRERHINLIPYGGPRKISGAGVDVMCSAFSVTTPGKVRESLLFGLALLAEGGNLPSKIMTSPPTPDEFDQTDSITSALVVRIAQESWENDMTGLLTSRIGNLGDEALTSACERIISTLENNGKRGSEFDRLLASLGKILPANNFKLNRRYMVLLQRALRRRNSGLRDPVKRMEFNLPRGIIELL